MKLGELVHSWWYSTERKDQPGDESCWPTQSELIQVSPLPLGWNARLSQGSTNISPSFPGNSSLLIHTLGWRKALWDVRARSISQEYNTFTQPGIIPRPLDLKSIALTFGRRVSHVPHSINDKTSQSQNYFVFSSSIYLTSPCVIIFVFKCMSLHLQSVWDNHLFYNSR